MDLPRPNVAAQRATSGHLHLGWNLRTPVHRGATARPRPLAALGRIAEYYAVTLRSDRGYVGVLAYNPVHSDYATVYPRSEPYDLAELTRSLPAHWRRPGPFQQSPCVRHASANKAATNVTLHRLMRNELLAILCAQDLEDSEARERAGRPRRPCLDARRGGAVPADGQLLRAGERRSWLPVRLTKAGRFVALPAKRLVSRSGRACHPEGRSVSGGAAWRLDAAV